MLDTFKRFLDDDSGFDMFITGVAGTGKTTSLGELVQYCIDNHIPNVVTAYTHKAKEVLVDKLPPLADVRTLHSFLRKRPGINQHATHKNQLNITSQFGTPESVKVIFVDEFSMVSESDALSLGELQDPTYEGKCAVKLVYIGDPNQLPPVKGVFTLEPYGKYIFRLTKVHRQSEGNGLLGTLAKINSYIEGEPIAKLEEHSTFIRGVDIVTGYIECKAVDKIILAYTNEKVQELNAEIHSKTKDSGLRWIGQLKKYLKFNGRIERGLITYIDTVNGPLLIGSKYQTLEFLLDLDYIDFGRYEDLEGNEYILASIFGHYNYKLKLDELGTVATKINDKIQKDSGISPKFWAQANPHTKSARSRALAWREFLSVSDCVMLIDYPYALTVHKSQGSTYSHVFIANEDLKTNIDRVMYLRLLYVAISRASNVVYMDS